ncbi:60S ribosomal protein L21-like [Phyllostomus discolor]|uniref:60S ribosomal protein L21 n=1 Tax=Phyllostomus discolor TaxID=89673 RepID=A0A7E6D2Q1_9CHIR|nr:60S ribosomal protein L21-like [Phyllostomus discolor]
MTNTKGKRRGGRWMFSQPFRKQEVAPLATYMRIHKKGDVVDIEAMGTVREAMPHRCHQGKAGRICSVAQHVVGTVTNKQVKGKILAKRINVCLEHTGHSQSQDGFLKCVKEKFQKKKKAQEKGAWVPPKHQPAPRRDTRGARTSAWATGAPARAFTA